MIRFRSLAKAFLSGRPFGEMPRDLRGQIHARALVLKTRRGNLGQQQRRSDNLFAPAHRHYRIRTWREASTPHFRNRPTLNRAAGIVPEC